MIRSRQRLSTAATRAALGLVLAGTFAGGGHAQTAVAHTHANHKPLRGNYPGSYITPAAGTSTPVAAQPHPNHKPLRGNYPGSYTSSPTAHSLRPSGNFDWVTAGVGAAGMLGLVLLLTALKAGLRTARRNHAHDVPLVLEVRDNRPA